MLHDENDASRRRFLKLTAVVTATTVALGCLPRPVRAAQLPPLSVADLTARALGYVEDAGKTSNPRHKAGDSCANCRFYSGGPTGYGPCALFPGKAVNARGWCVSHAQRN